MRVAVCCKGVPIDATLESVRVVDGDIQLKGVDYYINEFDAYAIETAIALKKEYNAETLALSLGPLRVQEVLYYALAKGIDRVARIDGETCRPERVAVGLLPALQAYEPDIILFGVQSEDWMGGEVGIYLSQALDMAFAYAVTEITDVTENSILVKSELGGGKFAEIEMQKPGILCVQSGIQPLRYLSRMKIKKARQNPIKSEWKLEPGDVGQMTGAMTGYEINDVFMPGKEGQAKIIEGELSEKAATLLEIIAKAV